MIVKKKINLYKDSRGLLTPIQFNKITKKKIKRVFIINLKKNITRGKHAHKKCTQFLKCLNGKIEILLINKTSKKKIILKSTNKYLIEIIPKTWVEIKAQTKSSSLLVLCDENYKQSDYIFNIKNL